MKFSVCWLKEWLKTDLTPTQIADKLTFAGLEVDSIVPVTGEINKDNHMIDIDLTPNRGDCLSIAGIAQELHALTGAPLDIPPIEAVQADHDEHFLVKLNAPKQCPRYYGRLITDITPNMKTPLWVAERLQHCGIKPQCFLVDVTNYVMLELGQPMHAFDAKKLGRSITVRLAKKAESLVLLDGKTITLTENDLVIADDINPVALAGVMGGQNTKVDESTHAIFLEAAFFTPEVIARTARGVQIHSDAAYRFQRGVNFNLPKLAIERATSIIRQVAGGSVGKIVEAESAANLPKREPICFKPASIKRLLGISHTDENLKDTFTRLGFKVKVGEPWQVTPPDCRFDVSLEADLVEEVARLWGLDNIPATTPKACLRAPTQRQGMLSVTLLKQHLTARGFQESINYSFIDAASHQAFATNADVAALINPLSAEFAVMRQSLLPSLVQAVSYNMQRQEKYCRFFEFAALADKQYLQPWQRIAGVLAGYKHPGFWDAPESIVDFYDAKAEVEALLALTKTPEAFTFQLEEHPAFEPTQTAVIKKEGKTIGYLGALNPTLRAQFDLTLPVFLFELNWQALNTAKPRRYNGISPYPCIKRDLAVVVDITVPSAKLTNRVEHIAEGSLESLFVFDVYAGKGIPNGKKSVGLRMTFRKTSCTLTDADADILVGNILTNLNETFNATLRE